jgi:hypothetical protein
VSALADGLQPNAVPLGELLVERRLITSEQLAIALAEQQASGSQLGAVLVARGFVAPTTIAAALATQHGGLLKTEYGFATGLGVAPEPPAPAGQPATNEVPALRRPSPQLVGAPAPPPAQPEAVAVPPASSPAEDPRLAALARERDELGAATAAASAEIERLATENARLAAQFAADREARRAEIDRLAAGNKSLETQLAELARDLDGRAALASADVERLTAENRSLAAQLAELAAERGEAGAPLKPVNGDLDTRLAELEFRLARVTNRGSTISERLDEVIGEVARLHERLPGER